jgi:hypothetical protein
MFLITGTRTVRIKLYTHHAHRCDSCKDFEMSVAVYQPYFHIIFMPVAPNGVKTVKAHCNSCGQPFRNDSMHREYEQKTRTPFYLYTLTILIGLLVVVGLAGNIIFHWGK